MSKIPNPDPTILLIALFSLMISFNFGRAAKTSFGQNPIVSSKGPLHLKILSNSLNGILPVSAVVIMVIISSLILNLAKTEILNLPYPLSELSFLYIQTRIGFVFSAILTAGIILWVIKEVLEPIILHYSLNRNNAKQLISEEFSELKNNLEKRFLKFQLGNIPILKKPSLALLLINISILVIILGLYGPTPDNILSRSQPLEDIIPNGFESEVLINSFSELANNADSMILRLENLIRYLSSLLWGG
jgi:hypothetical protein